MSHYPARGPQDAVLLPRCPACRRWAWPENYLVCAACGQPLEADEVEMTGTVMSAVLVHAGVLSVHLADGPYPVGLIQLDDGPLFVTRLAADRLPGPGTPIQLEWATTATGHDWPVARPLSTTT